MRYPEGTPEYDLRRTADKYGITMLFIIFNYIFIAALIQYIIAFVLLAFTGHSAVDSSSDAGYIFLLIENIIVCYAPPIALYAVMFRNEHKELDGAFRAYDKIPCEILLMFFAGGCMARLGALATNFISSLFNSLFSVPMPEAAFSSLRSINTAQFAAFEIISVIAAPICEELIYRHLLLRPMRRFGDLQAAFLTALIFALGHFNFDQFLYSFLFGFALAIVAIRRNSVIPSIVIHSVNNLLAGFSSYLPSTSGSETLDAVFAAVSNFCGYVGLFMIYGGMIALCIAVKLGIFRLREPALLPDSIQRRVIYTSPLVIIGIAASLALTFYMLYV